MYGEIKQLNPDEPNTLKKTWGYLKYFHMSVCESPNSRSGQALENLYNVYLNNVYFTFIFN